MRVRGFAMTPEGTPMRFTSVLAMAIVMGAAPAFAQVVRGGGFEVRTLSARADMVSGGDVLIQITAPPSAGTNVAITVNGRGPSAEFKPTAPTTTLIVRLENLRLGQVLHTYEPGTIIQRAQRDN